MKSWYKTGKDGQSDAMRGLGFYVLLYGTIAGLWVMIALLGNASLGPN